MANRPIELQNTNQSNSNQDGVISSSNSQDIPPETTTLFEQIAIQIHRYKSNFIYFQRLSGVLNLLELAFGFLTFILILIACNNYYDPWMGIVISGRAIGRNCKLNSFLNKKFINFNFLSFLGFAGGKVEVFFFLVCTYGLISTTIFTLLILISNSYEKSLNVGNFVSRTFKI